jgi:hypothetical protein
MEEMIPTEPFPWDSRVSGGSGGESSLTYLPPICFSCSSIAMDESLQKAHAKYLSKNDVSGVLPVNIHRCHQTMHHHELCPRRF